ncbi:MAG: DUF58 domain-containing protein [Clostridiales bacterium]|jgi:uncharacterized protein (DUF58 family)|nr:DUF58 domain-containing protein [Clostridiales bacterium]
MIKNRLLCLLVLLFALSFVFFYGGKVPYLLLYTVAATMLASAAYTVIAWRFCEAGCALDRTEIMKGEGVVLTLEISNRTPLFMPYVHVSCAKLDEFSYETGGESLSVGPFARVASSTRMTSKYRGHYDVNVLDVRVMDFLGLLSMHVRCGRAPGLAVYPQVAEIDDLGAAGQFGMDSSLSAGKASEDMSSVSDVRGYIDGDGMRKIHWKLSARAQAFMSKEYESETKPRIAILLNLCEIAGEPEARLRMEDMIVELAVSVVFYFLRKNWSASLCYFENGCVQRGVSDISLFERVYEELAFVGFNADCDIAGAFDIMGIDGGERQNVCVITPKVSGELLDRMLKASGQGCSVSLLYACEARKYMDSTLWASVIKKSAVNLYALDYESEIGDVLAGGGQRDWR